jgi:molybdopterin/thiamine biosynthesis adenylyltransferase/rhodanese-related sulfurtransferase
MAKTYRQLVAEALQQIGEIDVREAWSRAGSGAVVVDVREPGEWLSGTVPGALRIPRGTLESDLPGALPDSHDRPFLLVCAAGNRSALAGVSLARMGYTDVTSVAGGMAAWVAAGLPVETPSTLETSQMHRYSRHLSLTEVGLDGQRRLLDASVLLVGAGGLGSPAGLYLAAAGVGRIVIVDDDSVDASNLQRQVLHTTGRVGTPKVESAQTTIAALNPDVTVDVRRTRLTSGNVLDLMEGVDVVVDGADNFPTRYLVNDASLHMRIPVVHGSVLRFEGQASVFSPYDGPCYRCLFPLPPPPELAPNCAEAGVLGAVTGVIGTIQAVEALKLILDTGDTLAGRLLTYDALAQSFMAFDIHRNPDCPACGNPESPPPLVDYDATCAVPNRSPSGGAGSAVLGRA